MLDTLKALWPILVPLALAAALYLLITSSVRSGQQAAVSQAQSEMADAMVEAGRENTRTIIHHYETTRHIERATQENSETIRATQGAAQPIDPALHAAGIRALCVYVPGQCAESAGVLHGDGGARTPDPDAVPGTPE